MSTSLSTTPHIYQLPDEILSYVCLLAAEPSLLHKSMEVGRKHAEISFDAKTYRSKLAEELKVARALRLVSQRFSYLARPLIFERIVLIEYRTDSLPELVDMGANMKKLHDLFRLNLMLRHHCKALCVVHGELPWDIMDASHGHGEDDIGSKHEAEHERNNLIPFPALLNDFFNWMTNVTDLHIHEGYHISKIPDFSQALRSMPNLTALKMTGHIDYLQIFDQIITLEQGAALQTLDISDVTTGSWDYHDSDRQKVIQKLQEHTGTAPFTRLLAGPTLDVEVLMALVAWPKCLERFALHVDSSRIARHLVYDGSLQPALDIQKHSLTHLRIEGDYELGLSGFDLRDFPCLEHLCLCNATMSNFNQHPRNKTVVPDLDARIFAPRLRNLLWRLPWWLTGKDKMRDFFSRKHEKRLRSLLDMALKLKEERSDGEWQFEGIWVQSVLEVPDPLRVKRRRNFDKEMDRLRALGDEFRPLGIDIRHVPVPELKDNSMYIEDSVFEPLDRVWRWDDNFKFL